MASVDSGKTEDGSPQVIHDLIRATKQGSVCEVVRLLQDCKSQLVDVDTPDSGGYTALYHAADDGSLEACKALLNAGADCYRPCGHDGWTPLHAAAFMDHGQVVQLLVERGNEPDCLDIENATPLFWAARRGRVRAVSILIRCWADVNKRSGPCNGTPLIGCCAALVDGVKESWNLPMPPESNVVGVIRLLVLAPSVNVNIRNDAEETALYLACLAHSRNAVQLLLEAGAHPAVKVGPILDSAIDGMIQLFAGIPRVVADNGHESLSDQPSHSLVGTVHTVDVVRSAAVLVHREARILRLSQQVLSPLLEIDASCLNEERTRADRAEADDASVETAVTPSMASSDLLKVQIPAEAAQGDEAALAATLTARPPVFELPIAGLTKDLKCPPVVLHHGRGGSVALASPYVSISHSRAALVKPFSLSFVLDLPLKEHYTDIEEKIISVDVLQWLIEKDGSVRPWTRVGDDSVSVTGGAVVVKVDPNPNVAVSTYVAFVKSDSSAVRKELQFWILGPRHLSPEMITEVACTTRSLTAADLMKVLGERSQQSLQPWRGPDAIRVSSDSDITVAMSTREESWAFLPEQQSFPGSLASCNIQSATFCLESSMQQIGTKFVCSCDISATPDVTKSIAFMTPNAEMIQPRRRKETFRRKEAFCSGSYPELKKVRYSEAIAKSARSVCFISTERHGDLGTGTLVFQSGELSVVLTAQHVLEVPKKRGEGDKSILKRAIFRFHYKETIPEKQQPKFYAERKKLYLFSPSDELDYALIAVRQEDPQEECMVDPVPLQRLPQNYVRLDKWCFINQHPAGRTMETGRGTVGSLDRHPETRSPISFQHNVDTDGGSSGAAVCDDRCIILGVHTGEHLEDTDCSSEEDGSGDSSSDSKKSWNQATHINAIIDDLMSKKAGLQQDQQDMVTNIVLDQRS